MDEENGEKWQTVSKPKKVAHSPKQAGPVMEGTSKASKLTSVQQNQPKPPGFESAVPQKKKIDHQVPKKVVPLPEAIAEKTRNNQEPIKNQNASDDEELIDKHKSTNPTKIAQKAGPSVEERRKVEKEMLKKALTKIDYSSLEKELSTAKTEYSGSDRWVRLIVSRLNEMLSPVATDYSLFYSEKGFEWGYPLNIAPKSLTSLLDKLFAGIPSAFLEAFSHWCIKDACGTYLSQRKTIHGSQLLIQYLFKSHPSFASDKILNERIEEAKSYNSRRDEMLTIMWAYGQAGMTDFTRGFQAWYKLMFPLINGRGYTGFCLAYLQALFQHNRNKVDFAQIKHQEVFLNVFDAFFGSNSKDFSRPARTATQTLYQDLRKHLFMKDLKNNAANYFAQFLMRLALEQPEGYTEAACANLLECLKADGECLQLWLKKHPSGIKESQILLSYLTESNGKDARKLVHSTNFRKFLDDLESKPGKVRNDNSQDIAEMKQSIQNMRKRLGNEDRQCRRYRFGFFILFLVALIGGEIVYNGPKNSESIRAYKISKPYVINAWKSLKPLLLKSWNNFVKPASLWLWLQILHLSKLLIQSSTNLCTSVFKMLPEMHLVIESALMYLERFWALGVAYFGLALRKLDTFLLNYPDLSLTNFTSSTSAIGEYVVKSLGNMGSVVYLYYQSLTNWLLPHYFPLK